MADELRVTGPRTNASALRDDVNSCNLIEVVAIAERVGDLRPIDPDAPVRIDRPCYWVCRKCTLGRLFELGSELCIRAKMTVAAMQMAEKKACAHRS